MIEGAGRKRNLFAADSAPGPGDFPLGSRMSRAAARSLIEERRRPKYPPSFTIDLTSAADELCQEIYARLNTRPSKEVGEQTYMKIIFPPNFTPLGPTIIEHSELRGSRSVGRNARSVP
jgi:hypothetical protein